MNMIRNCLLLMMLSVIMGGCAGPAEETETAVTAPPDAAEVMQKQAYTLEKIVILSRHNLRSPVSSGDAGIDAMSIYPWFPWTSAPGELSAKGELLEKEMGEYFREWMKQEGLNPDRDNVRIYANSMQRTIRTAECFLDGFMPEADNETEIRGEYGTMDPVFMPSVRYYSPSYDSAVQTAFEEMKAQDKRYRRLQEDYDLLADVTGYEQTQGYMEGWLRPLDASDTQLVLYPDNPPGIEGSLVPACRLADGLLLQYYEEPDLQKAGFGRTLSEEEWKRITEIKELYNDTQYSMELIASSVSHPLLEELYGEMMNEDHDFSMICGHDSNLTSILSALGVSDYELPHTPEIHTPIGGKFLVEVWKDEDGNRFVLPVIVYQNAEQIRSVSDLSSENPPEIYELSFEGMQKNEDGMYPYDAWMERMEAAVNRLDQIREAYR